MSLLRFHRQLYECIYCLYTTYTEIHSIYFRLTPFVGEYNTIQAYSRFSKSQWHKGNINSAVEIWRDLLALLTSSSCWRQWVGYRVFICAVDRGQVLIQYLFTEVDWLTLSSNRQQAESTQRRCCCCCSRVWWKLCRHLVHVKEVKLGRQITKH